MADELKWLGLSEAKVRETLKNSALSDRLVKIVSLAKDELNRIGGDGKASKQQGIHLYQLGTRLKSQCDHYIPLLVRHVMNENIRNDAQLSAAIDFLLSHAITGVDEVSFLDACGVGVTITVEQIEDQVVCSNNFFNLDPSY
ncbi:hypothetical protein AB6A40_011280 [Gnathostoma spinigerum]|uniref:Glutaminyl-tRNA synthetase class Ib non-specific RNA-binding domain-containing protein n=1 Tax=Gnathostoma spinigerum TaxID=75299 RepID=A0ABD6EYX6_9BILA